MKKIITLFIGLASIGMLQAQTKREDARRVVLGQPKENKRTDNGRDVVLGRDGNENRTYPSSYPGSGSAEEAQINREYNQKIESIRNNPYLSAEEKQAMIRQLEKQRAKRLKEINRGSRNKDRYDNDDDDDDDGYKKSKSNRGKHKGWTKGKGNQKKRN